MEFEWDSTKARSNLLKHGIAFEDAVEVFFDPKELTDGGRVVHGEVRYQTIGRFGSVILLVVSTLRTGEDGTVRRRLISARRASRLERAIYD